VPNVVQRVPAKDRGTCVADGVWWTMRGGEATLVAAEWGESIASS